MTDIPHDPPWDGPLGDDALGSTADEADSTPSDGEFARAFDLGREAEFGDEIDRGDELDGGTGDRVLGELELELGELELGELELGGETDDGELELELGGQTDDHESDEVELGELELGTEIRGALDPGLDLDDPDFGHVDEIELTDPHGGSTANDVDGAPSEASPWTAAGLLDALDIGATDLDRLIATLGLDADDLDGREVMRLLDAADVEARLAYPTIDELIESQRSGVPLHLVIGGQRHDVTGFDDIGDTVALRGPDGTIDVQMADFEEAWAAGAYEALVVDGRGIFVTIELETTLELETTVERGH